MPKYTSLEKINAQKIGLIYDMTLEKEIAILEIFNSNDSEKLDLDYNDEEILYWMGIKYDVIDNNIEKFIKYCELCANKNTAKSVDAMKTLATYYSTIKNYDKMKKYYLMAIEHKDICAMRSLASYYTSIEYNDIEAKKYFMAAIYQDLLNYKNDLCNITQKEKYNKIILESKGWDLIKEWDKLYKPYLSIQLCENKKTPYNFYRHKFSYSIF